MPIGRVKRVVRYCTYNRVFFILVLILFGVLNFVMTHYASTNILMILLISLGCYILIAGYGMTITRDRINKGVALPRIFIRDVLNLGIKSLVVSAVYLVVQQFILYLISSPLDFPEFNLEELLLDLPETAHMLFSHNLIDALLFVVIGALLFYVTVFFMEIALARLADTGNIRAAFDLSGIKRDIDLMGWRHYAKDYTLIVLAIVIFTYLKFLVIPVVSLNVIWNTALDLFIFATEYLGIGAVYAQIKENKSLNE